MTHKAKKYGAGEYEYRGFSVTKGDPNTGWTYYYAGEERKWFNYGDRVETFKEAKQAVDNFHASQGA